MLRHLGIWVGRMAQILRSQKDDTPSQLRFIENWHGGDTGLVQAGPEI